MPARFPHNPHLPSPFQGEGAAGITARFLQFVPDRFSDAFQIFHDFMIGKAHRAYSRFREKSVATLVICPTLVSPMLVAVNLDREPHRRAIEIQNIRSDWMLPSE